MFKFILFYASLALLCLSCNTANRPLPVLGRATVNGADTVPPRIADFEWKDQYGSKVTNATFDSQVYVADFVFLSCPTICPVMTREMGKVYTAYAADNRVGFLTHSIDPERDSIPRLKAYAEALGAQKGRWYFVTGNQDSMVYLAEHSYYSSAFPDSTAPGGFVHSGGLLLVDRNRQIRGVYNGLEPEETSRLIKDIAVLLREQF